MATRQHRDRSQHAVTALPSHGLGLSPGFRFEVRENRFLAGAKEAPLDLIDLGRVVVSPSKETAEPAAAHQIGLLVLVASSAPVPVDCPPVQLGPNLQ